MKTLMLIAALSFASLPALAGGPVISPEEEVEAMVMDNPGSEGWVLPIVVGFVLLCAIACGGGDGPGKPDIICNKEC